MELSCIAFTSWCHMVPLLNFSPPQTTAVAPPLYNKHFSGLRLSTDCYNPT